MKIFTHFDKTIFMIYLTHDFISLLRKEDMSFRVVPVILKAPLSLKDRVVAYTSLDDIQLYALVVHWEYGEKVLITDDGLLDDIMTVVQNYFDTLFYYGEE